MARESMSAELRLPSYDIMTLLESGDIDLCLIQLTDDLFVILLLLRSIDNFHH